MRNNRTRTRRTGSVFLALWLCLALLPMGVFADDLPDAAAPEEAQDQLIAQDADLPEEDAEIIEDVPAESYEVNAGDDADVEGVSDETGAAIEEAEEDLGAGTPEPLTSFSRDGYNLKFLSEVVSNQVATELADAYIDHVWIKAGSTRMTVNWDTLKKKNFPAGTGLVVMRAAGPAKTYKEIARIPLWDELEPPAWAPEYSYVDKTASKKNTVYSYIVVPYFTDAEGYTYIARKLPDWAAGQTTKSKLKSVYKASISKSSVNLQYGEKAALKVTYAKPSTTYGTNLLRWYSDDTEVATVGKSTGKVTAKGAGTTYVHCRLASGHDVKCKVKAVWAYKPSAPKLSVDVASNSSITLKWNSVKRADFYYVYQSNDGLHWKDPVKAKGTSKRMTGLTKGHRYTFYITAVNDNRGYEGESSNSNVVNQKAVMKRRPTSVTGWPTSKTVKQGASYSFKITVSSPDGRKASLQMQDGSKWVTKKTISLASGSDKTSVTVTIPGQSKSSKWRLVIPQSNTSEEYTTKTLSIKADRAYQNPSSYVQISNKISKHGYSYYTSPVLINGSSTKSNCIEALIKTANKYLGDSYANGKSGAPGSGIDASGLIIQACYGAGVDLWPISPATRPANCVPKIMSSKLRNIPYADNPSDPTDHPGVFRGDLIFFRTGPGNIGHVAIYLGWDKIIHASPLTHRVETTTIAKLKKATKADGYEFEIAGVRRIFN